MSALLRRETGHDKRRQAGTKASTGAATFFSSCIPTVRISAVEMVANSDEQMIFSPKPPARDSRRAHRLTAGPITVKSSR
jgi:hypothetical protein